MTTTRRAGNHPLLARVTVSEAVRQSTGTAEHRSLLVSVQLGAPALIEGTLPENVRNIWLPRT